MQSYGDVQTLYTGTKSQGKVMVTFFDCMAAARARAALDGRQVNSRVLQVDFHASQKDAQQGADLPPACNHWCRDCGALRPV